MKKTMRLTKAHKRALEGIKEGKEGFLIDWLLLTLPILKKKSSKQIAPTDTQ